MIKNYCIKVISSVFIMLTIFMVSTSVFASDTETIIYDKFEIIIDKTNSKLYVTDTETGLSITYSLSYSISGYSDYVLTYSNYNDYPQIFSESNCFGILFFNDYNWNGTSSRYLTTNDGVYFAFQHRCSVSSGSYTFGIPWDYGFKITDSSTLGSRGTYWMLYNSSGVVTNNGAIIASSLPNIPSPFNSNVNLYEAEKKIIYEVNYSEDNKTALLSAEIKNGADGDKLYYSTLGYSLTGKLMNPIELNQSQATAITLSRNTMIHLQALDSER